MANRFPLIVNPTTKEIQEIAQNDNLDLTGNGIYAGGSLGQNGQVLTTNGTTVEWRTLTGGGGGGGGLDSDTTYIIEAEDQLDGASLNLVAGGTGIGTIRVKLLDNDELQFDTVDSLTIAPQLKTGGIVNDKLQNSGIVFKINGSDTTYNLGDTVTIPVYGDVFRNSVQAISNKTFTDCTMSLSTSAGNSIVGIPNSSLLNSSININGSLVELGGSITISGGGGVIQDENTTYTLSTVDWSDTQGNNEPDKKAIRLTGSDVATSNAVLVAGDRLDISRDAATGEIRLDATEVNTDTNTTYEISGDTLNQGGNNLGARLRLNGNDTSIDIVNLKNGVGITVNSISDSDIQFDLGQNVDPSSDVTFNDLTVTGNLIVQGAVTEVETTNLIVTDKTLTIADGVTNSNNATNAGIYIGTSNINFAYNHDVISWQSTSNLNLVPTKSYKIGGTTVLSSTQVLGKDVPNGTIVGSNDHQNLSNKTILSPVMTEIINTGTVYFPSPPVADTLVGRATSDILTNKTINGNNNTLQNVGNNALTNSYMVINGTQRNLGDSFTVESQDPYSDEKAQDAVAGSFTNGIHTGITFLYDDTTGRINATVSGGGGGGGATALDGLSDVNVSASILTGDILAWDTTNTEWVSSSNIDINGNITATGKVTTSGIDSNGQYNIKPGGEFFHFDNTSAWHLTFDKTGSSIGANWTYAIDASKTSVKLYGGEESGNDNNASVKLQTKTTGVDITGALDVTGSITLNGSAVNASGASDLIEEGNTSVETIDTGIDGTIKFETEGTDRWKITNGGHIIPYANAAYDIGNAEYKVRHLFLSDNSLWVGDDHKVSIEGGKMKFKKRKKSVVPASITAAGGNEAGALAHSGKASLDLISCFEWLAYLTSLDASKTDLSDLYPPEDSGGYTDEDYDEIINQHGPGKHPAPAVSGVAVLPIPLFTGNTFVLDQPVGDISLDVVGAAPIPGNNIDFKVYVMQGTTEQTIASMTIDGEVLNSNNIRVLGTIMSDVMQVFEVKCLHHNGVWNAIITAQ